MASSAVVGASMMALGSNAVEAGLLIIRWCAVVMLRGGKCTHMPQVREGRDCFCLEKTVKPKLQKAFVQRQTLTYIINFNFLLTN